MDDADRTWDLRNAAGWTARIGALGAALRALEVPDGAGGRVDVVLGFDDAEGYRASARHYVGVTIGRVANRIGGSAFELDGRRVRLTPNEGPHHLHGGPAQAFDRVVWHGQQPAADRVVLTRTSPAGEEGYPGTVAASVAYELLDDGLRVRFGARTDAPTPVSMTNHAYWDLSGGTGASTGAGGSVLDHELQVAADRYVEVDAAAIPTGRLLDVAGTPLDLRDGVVLGGPVAALRDTPAGGLDHALVLRGAPGRLREVARLHHPASGRTLRLASDQPGLQVYTGNGLDGVPGKAGRTYGPHDGVCLEPQGLPDAVNHPAFPSVVLHPDRPYVHELVVRITGLRGRS